MADVEDDSPVPCSDILPALDVLLLTRADIGLSVIPAGL